MSVWGVIASTSCVVMRSRTTRSMRERPVRIWFWTRLTHGADATVAEVVDVVGLHLDLAGERLEGRVASVGGEGVLHGRDNVVEREHRVTEGLADLEPSCSP
ncbi:hypothetical protein GCM10025876_23880 [Demequina litorisediminis]|uniref:Secreted protein n=1 Tax=Demequina litorisediminis TaxID=1849022 RepID=A0ABQ6IEP3_9MICO|nr:hypothetical protein GCM10025876_23880 [Demequina litorisediminis]